LVECSADALSATRGRNFVVYRKRLRISYHKISHIEGHPRWAALLEPLWYWEATPPMHKLSTEPQRAI
jgi:hypothetical protein